MINIFLKAKHWQIFLLNFAIPMIFQCIMMGMMMSNFVVSSGPEDIAMMIQYWKFIPLIMILSMGILFAWLWSIAIGLQKKLPDHVKMNVKRFKLFFFIPLVYLILFISFFSGMFHVLSSSNPESIFEPFIEWIGGLFGVIFLLHLFSMFCIFHSLYFVAKVFKTVELQREVHFGDFAGEFFMIWFYPVGIWIVQPKINKMMET